MNFEFHLIPLRVNLQVSARRVKLFLNVCDVVSLSRDEKVFLSFSQLVKLEIYRLFGEKVKKRKKKRKEERKTRAGVKSCRLVECLRLITEPSFNDRNYKFGLNLIFLDAQDRS
jgi:hypothetical protein